MNPGTGEHLPNVTYSEAHLQSLLTLGIDKAEFVQAYEGMKLAETAEMFGIKATEVYVLLHHWGHPLKQGRHAPHNRNVGRRPNVTRRNFSLDMETTTRVHVQGESIDYAGLVTAMAENKTFMRELGGQLARYISRGIIAEMNDLREIRSRKENK